jgi:hypothetical protein
VQLLGPVNVPLLIDLLLECGVEVDRRGGRPGDCESAPADQCGTDCHRCVNDDPGRPFRRDGVPFDLTGGPPAPSGQAAWKAAGEEWGVLSCAAAHILLGEHVMTG